MVKGSAEGDEGFIEIPSEMDMFYRVLEFAAATKTIKYKQTDYMVISDDEYSRQTAYLLDHILVQPHVTQLQYLQSSVAVHKRKC